jgi:hypothetical protein
MQHAERTFYEVDDVDAYPAPPDLRDPGAEPVTDTAAAFKAGLEGTQYLGIWTSAANLAYMRGRAARHGNPVIDAGLPSPISCAACSA